MKTFIRIVAIYGVLLVLVEFTGEFVIRRIESRQVSPWETESLLTFDEPIIGFSPKKSRQTNMGLWHVQTNRWGFRDREDFPLIKDPNELRIVVVGGSTVFGWGVDDNETVPAHLQSIINRQLAEIPGGTTKKIRVINAGCPWYASWHEAALVYFKVLEFSPDWVIVMDGLNDTADALSPTWTTIAQGHVDLPTALAAGQREQNRSHGLLGSLLQISPVVRYLHARLKAREQTKIGVVHPEVWDQYVHYMDRLAYLTKDSGVRFSLYFQPVMHVDKPLDIYETLHDGTSMAKGEFREKFVALYLEGEKRVLADGTLPATSLRKIFANEKLPIYNDGLHYNARGNQMIAQAIFDHDIAKQLPGLVSSRLP